MAISSQGTTFTFPGFTAHYTSISVEEPQAEIVDMTGLGEAIGRRRMVSTGDIKTPGRIRVDYIRRQGTPAPLSLIGSGGVAGVTPVTLSFSHSTAAGFSARAFLESASSEVAVGSLMRGSLSFVIDNSI